MSLNTFLVVCVASITFVLVIIMKVYIFGGNCETREGKSGKCVDINNCDALEDIRPLVCSRNLTKGVIYICCPTADARLSPKPPLLRVRGCGRRVLQVSPRVRSEESELRIIDDNQSVDKYSSLYSWPWIGGLYIRTSTNSQLLCSASVISKNYLLTSAHCFTTNGRTDPEYFVQLGSSYLNKGTVYNVTEIIIHEDYDDKNYENDIALIKLDETVDYIPVCLPTPRMFNYKFLNRTATVIGWGKTSYGSDMSELLKEVEVPIVSNKICNSKYKEKFGNITENMLCAGEEGRDACSGDGGGPLMLQSKSGKWVLVGLVSFGIGCGEEDYPGVYTRVAKYLYWLEKKTDIVVKLE